MTPAEGLAWTGFVFLVAAIGFGLSTKRRTSRRGWPMFALAIISWIAAIWVGVLT